MPVFDFSGASDKKPGVQSECTYTTFQSNEKETSPEKPIMILDNSSRQWKHHSCGIFTNPIKRTSFEFKEDDGVFSADIISIDSRFVSLLKWISPKDPTLLIMYTFPALPCANVAISSFFTITFAN